MYQKRKDLVLKKKQIKNKISQKERENSSRDGMSNAGYVAEEDTCKEIAQIKEAEKETQAQRRAKEQQYMQ